MKKWEWKVLSGISIIAGIFLLWVWINLNFEGYYYLFDVLIGLLILFAFLWGMVYGLYYRIKHNLPKFMTFVYAIGSLTVLLPMLSFTKEGIYALTESEISEKIEKYETNKETLRGRYKIEVYNLVFNNRSYRISDKTYRELNQSIKNPPPPIIVTYRPNSKIIMSVKLEK